MYIENDDFSVWIQKLYAKLEELCKDVRVLRNADRVLPEDDNLLDNQDLCLLFKVSIKTLQRYRAIGALPYFTISGKVYYKASDVREFIKERFSITTLRQFEKVLPIWLKISCTMFSGMPDLPCISEMRCSITSSRLIVSPAGWRYLLAPAVLSVP